MPSSVLVLRGISTAKPQRAARSADAASNCARYGVECVPSIPSQAPRGRKGGRKRRTDNELLERIAKLEGLVKNVEGNLDEHGMAPRRTNYASSVGIEEELSQTVIPDGQDRSEGSSNGTTGYQSQNSVAGLNRYLATSFWTTLAEEIKGLKDVLNCSSDEEDEGEDKQTIAPRLSSLERQHIQQANDSGFVVSSFTPVENSGNPTPHQLYTFCEIYLTNVDPVFKILHAPSLRRYLQEGAAKLDCSPGSRGLEALKFAVCYAAIVSMTDEECRNRIGEDRAVLITKYRAGVELGLAKADFVNTVEMSTLQALTIYLASVRVNDTRRLMWTLTSLAVRIAQAIGLHHESSSSLLRPFGREMRRRLWWQLCLLDSHAAQDRATNPVIYADSFNTRLPLQINDEDLHPDSYEDVEERQGFTDMTFSLICCEITDTVRQLNYVPIRELGEPQRDSQDRWNQRINAVINVQRRIEEKHLRYLSLARPFHWATRIVADVITAIMWLIVYRPLQQHPNSSFFLRFADPGILGLSVEVLERVHQLNTDPAASSFRWLARTYVQWHALAVTIAELCVKTEGPIVERAWAILIPVFSDASQHIADSSEGMLWRPIKKLMTRAQELRQEYLISHSARTDLSVRLADWNASDQDNHLAAAEDPIFVMSENEQVIEGVTIPIDRFPQVPTVSVPAPLDWDPWLAAASTSMRPSAQSHYNDDMNQLSWTNWENFVTGFQEQDEGMMYGLNDEAP
ncbi:hypothetical protein MMC11_003351 [Xylographa trunciseda]|nr:hypothetical protein [Xylographa trunciseda]